MSFQENSDSSVPCFRRMEELLSFHRPVPHSLIAGARLKRKRCIFPVMKQVPSLSAPSEESTKKFSCFVSFPRNVSIVGMKIQESHVSHRQKIVLSMIDQTKKHELWVGFPQKKTEKNKRNEFWFFDGMGPLPFLPLLMSHSLEVQWEGEEECAAGQMGLEVEYIDGCIQTGTEFSLLLLYEGFGPRIEYNRISCRFFNTSQGVCSRFIVPCQSLCQAVYLDFSQCHYKNILDVFLGSISSESLQALMEKGSGVQDFHSGTTRIPSVWNKEHMVVSFRPQYPNCLFLQEQEECEHFSNLFVIELLCAKDNPTQWKEDIVYRPCREDFFDSEQVQEMEEKSTDEEQQEEQEQEEQEKQEKQEQQEKQERIVMKSRVARRDAIAVSRPSIDVRPQSFIVEIGVEYPQRITIMGEE